MLARTAQQRLNLVFIKALKRAQGKYLGGRLTGEGDRRSYREEMMGRTRRGEGREEVKGASRKGVGSVLVVAAARCGLPGLPG